PIPSTSEMPGGMKYPPPAGASRLSSGPDAILFSWEPGRAKCRAPIVDYSLQGLQGRKRLPGLADVEAHDTAERPNVVDVITKLRVHERRIVVEDIHGVQRYLRSLQPTAVATQRVRRLQIERGPGGHPWDERAAGVAVRSHVVDGERETRPGLLRTMTSPTDRASNPQSQRIAGGVENAGGRRTGSDRLVELEHVVAHDAELEAAGVAAQELVHFEIDTRGPGRRQISQPGIDDRRRRTQQAGRHGPLIGRAVTDGRDLRRRGIARDDRSPLALAHEDVEGIAGRRLRDAVVVI